MTRQTRVLRVDPARPDPGTIAEAAAILRQGGLVAFPTETVYGLGANALDPEAIAALYAAKERAADDPLIVHVLGEADLATVVAEVPAIARMLVARCWPGPLTLVLPRRATIAPAVSAGLETVAVRAPAHPVARALLAAAGVPVAAPSANRFMRTSGTTAEHVLEDLEGRIDLILDGGPAPAGIESTVVAIEGQTVRILREGALTAEALRAALADVPGAGVVARAAPPDTEPLVSPGMLAKHYAPRKPFVLVRGSGEAARRALLAAARTAAIAGERPGVLAFSGDLSLFDGWCEVADLGPEDDLATVAHRLFAALRLLDRSPATRLFGRTAPDAGLGRAINDRLQRAAGEVLSPES